MLKILASSVTAGALALCIGSSATATTWSGTAYFTYYTNHQVSSVTYSYNDATHNFVVGTPKLITTLPGADGLIFAPGGKSLIVGGQGPTLYDVNISNGTYTSANAGGPGAYHVTLSPSGNAVYTSGPYGQSNAPLSLVPLSNFGTANAPTLYTVTGSDTQVTQLAFADGKTFYTDSQPNCCGNVGLYDLSTNVTTALANRVSAHGLVYDPYSGLLDAFGGGDVSTVDPVTDAVSKDVSINGANFDQGSPDGFGHALIAGSGGITFIDYRGTSILTPNYVTFVGGFSGIDDIAPLSGPGSNNHGVPEPATWVVMLLGSAMAGAALRRRRSATA